MCGNEETADSRLRWRGARRKKLNLDRVRPNFRRRCQPAVGAIGQPRPHIAWANFDRIAVYWRMMPVALVGRVAGSTGVEGAAGGRFSPVILNA